jgi:Uncharacterised protein family (UPF0236)
MEHIVTLVVDGRKEQEVTICLGAGTAWEEQVTTLLKGILAKGVQALLEAEDAALQAETSPGWRNLGRESRVVVTAVGEVTVRRRVYRDEDGQRRKPLDEELGLEPYQRMSWGVQGMTAHLATHATYRDTSAVLSRVLDTSISRTRVQRAVWRVGTELAEAEAEQREGVFGRGEAMVAGTIPAEWLYAEVDGILLALQREERRRVEARVGILYTGKESLGKGRHRLTDRVCVLRLKPEAQDWQEDLLLKAHQTFDFKSVQRLVLGGDGAGWVRNSLDRFEMSVIYQLDRYHLFRAAREVGGALGQRAVELTRRVCLVGWEGIEMEVVSLLHEASPSARVKLQRWADYLREHADGLIDYRIRLGLDQLSYPSLGAIEGNVDKRIAHRMKGQGKSWRLPGARAMLALLEHQEALAHGVFRSERTPRPTVQEHVLPKRPRQRDDGAWLAATLPVLHGCAEGRPWVQYLKRLIQGEPPLPVAYARP